MDILVRRISLFEEWVQMKMPKYPRLPSVVFDYENSAVHLGFNMMDAWDFDNDCPRANSKYEVLGWCPARELRMRPRTSGIAIMVEDTETFEQIWFHVTHYEEI